MPFTDEEIMEERIHKFKHTTMLPALESITTKLKAGGFKIKAPKEQDEVSWRGDDYVLISFRLILKQNRAEHHVRLESECRIGGSILPAQAIQGNSDIMDIEASDIEYHFFNKSVPANYLPRV